MSRAQTVRARERAARRSARCSVTLLLLSFGLPGCVLTPDGTDEERHRLEVAGKPFEPVLEDRSVPELPAEPTWRDVLQRAFLTHGELEAAYYRWKAALERIDIAGAYPNSDVNVGFSYEFSSERMNSFDRSTFSIGFDSMENLALPNKVAQAAKVALDEARVTGAEFRAAKFDLQRKVLYAWSDYTLQAHTIALKREELSLRRMASRGAEARAAAGERGRALLGTGLEISTAESQLRDLEAEHHSTRATLNALLGRDPRAELKAPLRHAPARPIPQDDFALVQAAADMFPEVAAFSERITARQDALELARLRWIPDINPSFIFTGSIMQAIGAAIVLPTTVAEIRGRIREAQAQVRESEAVFRQRRADRIGEYVSLLFMLRSAERREREFRTAILPALQRLADDQARAYEAGAATFADLIESRRALLDARLTIEQARAQIEKATVEIECCLGVDIETIAPTQGSKSPPEARSALLASESRHD